MSSTEVIGTLGIFGIIALILLVVLWIVLPFAIFGVKALLRDLLHEQRRTNVLLSELQARQAQSADESSRPAR